MLRFVVLSVVVLASHVSAGEAQLANSRRGVWLGLGAGTAGGKATCSVCDATRGMGPAGQIRLGGTVSRSVLASVEATGWRKKGVPVDRSLAMISAVGTLYPVRELGLHLKAGLGGYSYVEEDAVTKLTSQGLALQVGVGYDVAITPRVGLAPFATLITSGSGNPARLDKASGFKQPLFSDLSLVLFQVGLALTLY